MNNTPQTKLGAYNRRYLALRRQVDQEKSHFRYPAPLIEEMTAVRNTIVELQSTYRSAHRSGVSA